MRRRPKGPDGGRFAPGERCEQVQSDAPLEQPRPERRETGVLSPEWQALREALKRFEHLDDEQREFQKTLARLSSRYSHLISSVESTEDAHAAASALAELAAAERHHSAVSKPVSEAYAQVEKATQRWVEACVARVGASPESAKKQIEHLVSVLETAPQQVPNHVVAVAASAIRHLNR